MEPQFFLVVIDTVESTTVRNLPKGIVNTYVVQAMDENHARQMVLRTMAPQIANQLIHSLYVYDLDAIMYNVEIAGQTGRSLPMFSFMPLNGARPPRALNLPTRPRDMTPEGVTDVTSTVSSPAELPQPDPVPMNESVAPQVPPQPHTVGRAPVNPHNKRDVRSAAFQQHDYQPQGQVNETLSEEQAQIVASLGVYPQRNGANEGVNNRINGAVGQNLNQSRVAGPGGPTNNLSPEQLALIQQVGADTMPDTTVTEEAGLYEEDYAGADAPAWEPDESVSQIDGEVISDEKIAQIQEEFQKVQEQTGIEVADSRPNAASADVSMQMGESNIDQGLQIRAEEEGIGNE